jgi:NAD+ diphosphatase
MSPRPDLGPKPRLGYAESSLERATERRADASALAAFADDQHARAYLVAGDSIILNQAGAVCDPLFTLAQARTFGRTAETVFLGLHRDAPRFAIALEPQAAETLKTRAELVVTDLRSIAVRGLVEANHLAPLAEGKALLNWHGRHRFCSTCGAATDLVEGGWRRDCPVCRAQHFPRTDPVVIMLAVAGERCVLGRSHRFQPGMWSCLAGFVEPGEAIEDAVRRETQEEAGIVCGRVRYFAAVALSHLSDDRLPCRGMLARNRHRPRRTRRRPLVRARGGRRHALAPASRRPHHAADHGDRLSHHPRLGGGRGFLQLASSSFFALIPSQS